MFHRANRKIPSLKPERLQTEVAMMVADSKLLAIRKKLLKQRQDLLSEAEHTLNSKISTEKESFPDPTDQAVAELDNNFMLKLRGREQKLLKKIDEAISRIDGGNYGVCESCGGEISVKRLEARPVTTLCIECKTAQEEEEKRLVD
jgi:DnaK suppressor protein